MGRDAKISPKCPSRLLPIHTLKDGDHQCQQCPYIWPQAWHCVNLKKYITDLLLHYCSQISLTFLYFLIRSFKNVTPGLMSWSQISLIAVLLLTVEYRIWIRTYLFNNIHELRWKGRFPVAYTYILVFLTHSFCINPCNTVHGSYGLL